jgi:hypothetical protein
VSASKFYFIPLKEKGERVRKDSRKVEVKRKHMGGRKKRESLYIWGKGRERASS